MVSSALAGLELRTLPPALARPGQFSLRVPFLGPIDAEVAAIVYSRLGAQNTAHHRECLVVQLEGIAVVDQAELTPLEEHLLACPVCAERAEEGAAYVDALRAAIVEGNFDLE